MAREILTAANSGFCFGVKQAIEKTEEEIRRKAGKQLTRQNIYMGSADSQQDGNGRTQREGRFDT